MGGQAERTILEYMRTSQRSPLKAILQNREKAPPYIILIFFFRQQKKRGASKERRDQASESR